MRTAKGAGAGFTLLEVVLALTALALLTTICYAAFNLATRAVQAGTKAVVTQQRLRAVVDMMMRQIKSAFAYPMLQDGTAIAFFRCEPGRAISFITASGQLTGGTPSWVSYELTGDPPQLRIYESTAFDPETLYESFRYPYPSERMDPETRVEAPMLDGFTSMTLGCGPLDEGSSGRFNTDDEDGSQQLPLYASVGFEGLPGFPGVFHQRIPLMAPTFSEDSGTVIESLAEQVEGLEDLDETDEDGDADSDADKETADDEGDE